MPAGNYSSTMCAELNRLANGGNYPSRTAFLDEQGAANKWAGTTGKSLVAALNIKNGTTNPSLFKNLGAVCNALASTTGKSPLAALTSISGVTAVGYFAYGRSNGNNAIYAYTFSDDSGIGSATTNLSAITIGVNGNAFTGDTSPGAILFGEGYTGSTGTTSTMRAYQYTTAAGIGTAYTAVTSGTTYQSMTQGVFASGYGAVGFALNSDTSRFKMYPWSDSTGFGTAYSGTGVTDSAQSMSWARNNEIVTFGWAGSGAVGDRTSLRTYSWTNASGLGTQFTTHALTGPRGSVTSVGVNNSSNVIWGTGTYDGHLHFLTYTSSGYGTYLGSVTYSIGYMNGAGFNSTDTQMVASCTNSTPRGYAWSNTTGVGTQYSNPSSFTATNQGRNKVTFTSSDKSVVIGQDTYAWSATGFGTKYAVAAGLPATVATAVLGK